MEKSPLDQAYALSRKADLEVQQRHYEKAASFYGQAFEKYSEAIKLTSSPEAKRTLEILKSQSSAHASFLSNEKNINLLPPPPKTSQQGHGIQNSSKRYSSPISSYTQPPISSGNLTTSLASARGKPIGPMSNYHTSPQSSLSSISSGSQKYKLNSHYGPHEGTTDQLSKRNSSQPHLDNADEDPFFKFYSNITTIVSKTHTQTRDKTKFTNKYFQSKGASPFDKKTSRSPSSSKLSDTTISYKNPTDSYYLVPKSINNESPESLATENANLKEALQGATRSLEAYSDTFERQRDAIKSSLGQLRVELQAKEQSKIQELNAAIEELQSENDKLKIQMGRMKSRWEGLKESARKRR